MTARHPLYLAAALVTVAGVADAQQSRDDLLDAMTRHVQICAEISDSAQRLACYDKVQNKVGDVQAPAPARTPTPLGTMPSQPSLPPLQPANPPPPAYTGGSQVGNPTPLDPPPSSYTGGSQLGSPTPLTPPPLAVPGGGTATLGGAQGAPTPLGPPSSDPDRAFNPRDSAGSYRPADASMPRPQPPLRRTGPRPVPNYNQQVPLVTLAASNLTYGESRYWQVTVTVTSNTARSLDTQVRCNFLNAGRSVGEAYLGPVLMAAGEQVSTELIGPPTTTFVDSTNCRVMSP
ncbi:hypothetical protein [Reyranella sp.]|uniref:hypothetical protein n=1 Tax=Reyranella sp. TaxID=1929291 RepID=UPI003D110300